MNITLVKVIGGVIVVIGIIFLVYIIAPFFITKKVDEVLPISQSAPTVSNETRTEEISPQKVEDVSFPIIGTKGHPAEGVVKVVQANDRQYLRYENFKTINGPDLVVYLAKDLEAKEYVSLGKLKATEGNINYEIPAGVNVDDYKYALVWCDAFSVLFNYAELR